MSEFTLIGRELETPLINAAGSINGTNPEQMLREVETLAATSIGAITIGSFTVPEQAGNEVKFGGPTYFHDEQTHTTYNSMGLPNLGLEGARILVPEAMSRAHDHGKPLIVSVSPTQPSEEHGDTFLQVKKLVYAMQLAGADLIEVNTSCPNVVTDGGGRKPILGYDFVGMHQLIEELAPLTNTNSSNLGVKLPPYTTVEERKTAKELAPIFRASGVFGFLVTANTIPNQVPLDKRGNQILNVPGGAGGMSGPSTRDVGRDQLRLWKSLLGNELDIISTLGVDSGNELAVRQALGATAAGGVTFLWESQDWGKAVTDVITEWSESDT